MRKMVLWGLWLVCGMASLAGAQTSPAPKVIAFAQDTLKNDFRQAQVAQARAAAAKLPGMRFVASDAQGQTSLLILQIDQFIEQKVDALIVGTNDEEAVVPVVRKAYKAGIPVIVLDRGIKGSAYTTFINSDNEHIGTLAGDFIGEKLAGKGSVLLLEGIQTADVTQLRSRGFLQAMKGFPGIQVIRRTGNYLRKDALLEMQKLLAQGVRVDAIFAESDSMLSGARMAMQAAKVDPKNLITVGCDYTSEAREAIRSGTQTASILFPLGGDVSVDVARRIFARENVPRHVVIPVKLVTRANVDQVAPIF